MAFNSELKYFQNRLCHRENVEVSFIGTFRSYSSSSKRLSPPLFTAVRARRTHAHAGLSVPGSHRTPLLRYATAAPGPVSAWRLAPAHEVGHCQPLPATAAGRAADCIQSGPSPARARPGRSGPGRDALALALLSSHLAAPCAVQHRCCAAQAWPRPSDRFTAGQGSRPVPTPRAWRQQSGM